MGLLDLFGFGKSKAKMQDALQQGALIIDVRSSGEYKGGHVKGSVNIPLETVATKMQELKSKNKPVVFCCASGMRSGMATRQAKSAGLDAHNGGGWQQLKGVLDRTM